MVQAAKLASQNSHVSDQTDNDHKSSVNQRQVTAPNLVLSNYERKDNQPVNLLLSPQGTQPNSMQKCLSEQ